MRVTLITAVLLAFAAPALAQEGVIEMLRQDLKTEKVAIMAASLQLTEKEGEAFWPIYREYGNELSKLGDRRLAVLRKFAGAYDTIDAATAKELIEESFDIVEDRTSLLRKTYGKVADQVGPLVAARFVQIETQMLTLVDAQIMDQVPLVKTSPSAPAKD